MNPKLPNAREPIQPGGAPPTSAWRKYFESLAAQTDNADLQAQLLALAERVSDLENEDGSANTVLGRLSVHSVGTLATGDVVLTLIGDLQSPGNSYYYGTSDVGVKGWHVLPIPPDLTPPYFIPADETYTVAVNKQALFTMPIDVEGFLDVEGYLVEVG